MYNQEQQPTNIKELAPPARYGYAPPGSIFITRFALPAFQAPAARPLRPVRPFQGVTVMSDKAPAAIPAFTTALLLAQSEEFAVIDRRALRDVGISQVRVLTSGVYAARFLAGREKSDSSPQPDIVLVHHQLADMSGADFVGLVRSHPRLVGLPVLHISSSDTPEEKLQALANGYSAVLTRPYSDKNMRASLAAAASFKAQGDGLRHGQALLNTSNFDKALEHFAALGALCIQENPQQSFYDGLELLRKREWDSAIRALQRALKLLAIRGEAEFGLALAWKGKGDQHKYKSYLERAGNSFAQAAKWHRARVVYARLLRDEPGAQSPFLLEAERLLRAGEFEVAATALAEGHTLTAKGPIRERLARTLAYNSENPEDAALALRRSLERKAPHLAEELAGEVREELDEQLRRIQERKQDALTGSELNDGPADDDKSSGEARKGLFLLGLPLSEEEAAPGPPAGSKPTQTGSKSGPQIELLSENSLSSSLFGDSPHLNEALTVAKLTWKLFRSGKI